ncbi:HNH endonuclease [Halalkalibacter krulwichiae]|uniref:HNH endonuclease n=1 Tax=Halalkalibacter krulwichiae TaxID=199441 RepID=UPI000826AEE2|nr:HNH endonuclease [Halalkalibacter krulwichiae]
MKNDYEIRDDVTVIFVKCKKRILETFIDTKDLDKARSFSNTWYAHFNQKTNSFYIRGDKVVEGTKRRFYLHRWLWDLTSNLTVDHFNNNTLDNRRSVNLRILTNAQNQQNKKGARKDSVTGIRGVEFKKDRMKFQARLAVNKKRINLGYFDDMKEAEIAVKNARKKYMPFSKEGILS